MDSKVWVPLAAVIIGGLLTTVSSLIVEIFRNRTRQRTEVRQRRRSGLEELERAAVDAHAKILSAARLADLIQSKRRSTTEASSEGAVPQMKTSDRDDDDQLLLTVLAEGTGKIELLRSIGLATRVGSHEIQRAVTEYTATQLAWTQSPTKSGEIVARLESQIELILQHVARELQKLDEADESDASTVRRRLLPLRT